jgi:hypothetical protein
MYYSTRGNEKLGSRVVVVNRPTSQTCPSDCFFLNNGCYRQSTEKRFSHAKESSHRNIIVCKEELIILIQHAIRNKKVIRLHEGGDFMHTNSQGKKYIDKKYLHAWKLALLEFPRKEMPDVWVYTHVFDARVSALRHLGVKIYASIHSIEGYIKAKKAGFKLFAWVLQDRKKKGGSKDAPKYVNLPVIGRTLVCPEQRLGRKRVQCTLCKWCITGKGNIAFLTH